MKKTIDAVRRLGDTAPATEKDVAGGGSPNVSGDSRVRKLCGFFVVLVCLMGGRTEGAARLAGADPVFQPPFWSPASFGSVVGGSQQNRSQHIMNASIGAPARAQTSPSAPVSSPAPTPFEAARAALGQHPRDVASYLHAGAESLFWLESVFHAIELLHERGGGEIRIRHLVGLGKYVAADMGDMLDCAHEKIVEALDAAEAAKGDGKAAKGGAA